MSSSSGAGRAATIALSARANLGLKVACVDSRGTFGGTCLNVGCIPSKALLHTTELYEEAKEKFPKFGISGEALAVDLTAMMAHKDKVVGELTKGVEFLFRKNKVEAIVGEARIVVARQSERENQGRRARTPDQAHRHRHRLRRGAAARRDHRRKADRVLHRRADAGRGAQEDCWWWVPASSASNWARCGAGLAPMCWWWNSSIASCRASTWKWPSNSSACWNARA